MRENIKHTNKFSVLKLLHKGYMTHSFVPKLQVYISLTLVFVQCRLHLLTVGQRISMCKEMDVRRCVCFWIKLGRSAAEATEMIELSWSENAVRYETVGKWFVRSRTKYCSLEQDKYSHIFLCLQQKQPRK